MDQGTKYHYVYYSYEEWGRGYIGVRSSNVPPELDTKYRGSFQDKSFKPTEKIILMEFKSRLEADQAEIKLHKFFQVAANPNFANKINSSSDGFNRLGAKNSEYVRKTISKTNKGNKYCVGRKVSQKTRKLISAKVKGKLKGEKNPMYGKTHTKDVRSRIGAATKNRLQTEGHPMKGKNHTEETKRKIADKQNRMSVRLQNIKTGEIFEFNSQLEAAKELGIYQGSISHLCRGKLKTTAGWRLAN